MTRLGVTGMHKPPSYLDAVAIVDDAFDALTHEGLDITEVTTGAAPGVDTAAFYCALSHWPRALHRVLVPKGLMHNEPLVAFAESLPNVEIHEIAGGYLKRDDAIVENTDLLAAFPRNMAEQRRGSGTWATVRRGRKRGCEIRYWPLAGE